MLIFDFFRRHPLPSGLLLIAFLTALAVFFHDDIAKFGKPRLVEIKNSAAQEQPGFFSELKPAAEGSSAGNEEKESVNFLILGAAGQGYDAPDLTDTILIAHFNYGFKKIYLFSLPRDLLVKIPGQSSYTKLNALYALARKDIGHEFDPVRQKAQEITGLPINHYLFIDLDTVKNLVDILGGINVMVKKDIVDTTFPGPNHSFETFEIKSGWRYLDGETALKYIRSRHSLGGDFDRIERQQEVLQAIKQKVLSLHFWDIPTFLNIFETLSSRLKTDLGLWQIKSFWQEVKDIPGGNLIKNEIDNANLLIGGQTILGGETASVLRPKAGIENYEEIKNYIAKIISDF